MVKKNLTKSKGLILAVCVLIIAFCGYSGYTNSKNASIYENVIVSICQDGEYQTAQSLLEELPENYKDSANIQNYLTVLVSYDDAKREKYSAVLSDLDKLNAFTDDRLQQHFDNFKTDLSNKEKEYQLDFQSAQTITDEITSIGDHNLESVQLSDETAIVQARKAYTDAKQAVQQLVGSTALSYLEQLEERLAILKTDQEQAEKTIALINAIGDVSTDSEDAITTAETAYQQLSDNGKAQVTNYETLTLARTTYTDITAAQPVIALINEIENEADAAAAENQYNKLTDAQKSYVSNYNEIAAAKERLAASGQTYDYDDASDSDSGYATVYWVPNGKVYHITKNCPTLSRSKTINSGSVSQSGKPRACKVCA